LENQAEAVDTSSATHRIQVPSGVMAQRILHRLDPVYPETARQAGIAGAVILNVIVATDGTVKTMRPLSGPKELTQSAMDAVRWWKFQPSVADGGPVEVETTVAIEFRP
jgi:TonB family protein